MSSWIPYFLGSYRFNVAQESPRVHSSSLQEMDTISKYNYIDNLGMKRILFVIREHTQAYKDVLFLKVMLSVPELLVLKTSSGDFNVVINEVKFYRKENSWDIEIRAVEADECHIIKAVFQGTNFRLENDIISVEAERAYSSRAGSVLIYISNKDNARAFFADTAQIADLYIGNDNELYHFGEYNIRKIYHNLNGGGNTIRLEGTSNTSFLLSDTIYINDQTWNTSTSIYNLITADSAYSILYNTSVSGSGVSTLLQSRYLTTERVISAGTTKLQALDLLIEYIFEDLQEEWIGYTSDTLNILYVQPARQELESTHTLTYGENLVEGYATTYSSDKNWIAGYGVTLGNVDNTSVDEYNDDANYIRKHNCSCLLTYDHLWTVATDTGTSEGVLASWDPLNFYIEHYRDEDHTYNCCFCLTSDDILIGSNTHILHFSTDAVFQEGTAHELPTSVNSKSKPVTEDDYIAFINDSAFVYSDDAGDTWSSKSTPTGVNLALSGNNTRYWLLVSDAGTYKVYYSVNQGDSWTLSTTIESGAAAYHLCATDTAIRVIYSIGATPPYSVKVRYSNDSGSSWNTSTVETGLTGVFDFVECQIATNYTYAFHSLSSSNKIKFSRSSTGATWSTPVELTASGSSWDTAAEGEEILIFWIVPTTLVWRVAYSNDEGDTWNYPDETGHTWIKNPGYVEAFGVGLYLDQDGFDYENGIIYSLDRENWSIGFTTEEWDYSLNYGTAYDKYIDVLYRKRDVYPFEYYHRRYFLEAPVEMQAILDVIAFSQLGTRYFALTSIAELYYSDTPLSEDSWALAKDFGTLGVDLISDGTNLYVAYDDKVQYASGTIDDETTWTNLVDNSGNAILCFGRACNVIYVGSVDYDLRSFSDPSLIKLETNTEHGVTNAIYAVTDVMGDIFMSHGNGNIERLWLTLQGDDTDWQSELSALSTAPFKQISKIEQNYVVLLSDGHFLVGKIQSPSESNRLRSVARDLTDIDDRGKLPDAIVVTSGEGTYNPSALCAAAYLELTERASSRVTYNITTLGSTFYYINELCDVDWDPYSGSVEIRKVQVVMNNSTGFLVNLDLGERFPSLGEVLDNWFGGG